MIAYLCNSVSPSLFLIKSRLLLTVFKVSKSAVVTQLNISSKVTGRFVSNCNNNK
jgi:hypothetical protein